MSTSTLDAAAVDVDVDEKELRVTLRDGRAIIVPISWFPRLKAADPDARAKWRLIGDGEGIHWVDLDEDLSVAALLRVS
ncbi:DUF2442 domain-containing protein [Leucobacter tenebrionis]|uniref:DUF2442 domain-containing protein n=1 Tax=Leucobacter tenebrionis TaxID=2873270 RepID=UPI001CA6A402|nr:DUF2442 domain-containing protein [Leucobacter tenebrionis]QZY51471.1 DUF2442 domain-containing protein [Leucobacter tenebrionis]